MTDKKITVSVEEMADMLGISRSVAYQLIKEKDFPVIKIGSRLVVPRDKFIAWVESHFEG